MRIDELTGVKRYKKRTLWDVLNDFAKAGGHWAGGKFGTVLLHPRWDYVYKFFTRDDCYLRFIRWAMRNSHPCLPKVLSKPRRILPFYRRHKTEEEIYIVKLERLNEWKCPPEVKDMGGFAYVLEHVALTKGAYDGDEMPEHWEGRPKSHIERWHKTKDFLNRHPEIKQLADFYLVLLDVPIDCALDIHVGNVMQRNDGTLVFTDPFWYGETPYTLAAAARAAEMDIADYEPDEADYIDGGERWKKPRPPKQTDWRPSSDDLPF